MTDWKVTHGDCRDVMAGLDADSVDSIVTDPPYGLTANKKGGSGVASVNTSTPCGRARIGVGNGPGGFMGMKWDHAVPGVEFWAEALRVAKPGAHLLAFGGTRTFHRLAVAIEDAGWEVRDTLSWLYGSGFPKSHNGPWGGTALKPAWEPIIMARKPLIGTVASNVSEHGTGGLNIEGCRIGTTVETWPHSRGYSRHDPGSQNKGTQTTGVAPSGRWPANVVLDEEAGAMLGEPSRFFYCAKASRAEREAGLEGVGARRGGAEQFDSRWKEGVGDERMPTVRNHHPTVKPIALMRWLCRLVTPPGGLVLDPFTGSGTTGCAAVAEGFRFHGIELSEEYAEIARRRIAHHLPDPTLNLEAA